VIPTSEVQSYHAGIIDGRLKITKVGLITFNVMTQMSCVIKILVQKLLQNKENMLTMQT
jgi:hypothetical protein